METARRIARFAWLAIAVGSAAIAIFYNQFFWLFAAYAFYTSRCLKHS